MKILKRALAKDPGDRYGSCAELEEALRQYRKDVLMETAVALPPLDSATAAVILEQAAVEPKGKVKPEKRHAWLLLPILGCVGIVAVAMIWLFNFRGAPAETVKDGPISKRTGAGGGDGKNADERLTKKMLVELSSVPDNGKIFLDGSPVGQNPLSVTPDGKPHVIRIEAEGYEPHVMEVTAGPGREKMLVEVKMEKAAGAPVNPAAVKAKDGKQAQKASGEGAQGSGEPDGAKGKTTLKKAGHATMIETDFDK